MLNWIRVTVLLLVTLAASLCLGQFVQIGGSVLDPNGTPYYTGKAQLISGNGSGPQSWTFGGTNPVNPLVTIAGLDAYGNFSVQLMNTSLIDQQSAQPEWQFSFCSAGSPPPIVCFNVPALALTSDQSITGQINAAPPPVIPGSGANINLTCPPPIGTIVYACNQVGADIGAKVNAAIASNCQAEGCRVIIPSSGAGYSMSTAVANTKSGVSIECADPGTVITWTPASGTAFSTTGTNNVTFKGCNVQTSTAATTATCISPVSAQNTQISGWNCVGFNKGTIVTGTDTNPSGNTIVANSHDRNYTTVGLQCDHAIDTYVNDVDNYAPTGNATHAWGTIVDTGCSGFYPVNLTNGSAGMMVRNSMPTTNLYGKPPNYILGATNVINDTCYNSACLLFDASLSTLSGPGNAFVGNKYYFYGGWSSGCQLTSCAGIDVEGGVDIKFFGHASRANSCHGALLNYAKDANHGIVEFNGVTMNDNNIQNGACDNYHVTANTSNWKIIGGYAWGTGSGDCCSSAKYGINIGAGADNFTVDHVDIQNVQTAPVLDASTGFNKVLCWSDGVSGGENCPTTTFNLGRWNIDSSFFGALQSSNPTIAFNPNTFTFYDRTGHAYDWVDNSNTNMTLAQNGNLFIRNNLQIGAVTGSTQCLHTDSAGNVSGTGSDCGSGGGGGSVNPGTTGHFGFYASTSSVISDMGSDFTFNLHTLTGSAFSVLDLHSAGTGGFLLSGAFNTGVVAVTTGTGQPSSVTGTSSQLLSYNASGVPTAVSGLPVYTCKQLSGVVCDGTSEGPAFQSALNALSNGSTTHGANVYLTAGDTPNMGTTAITVPIGVYITGTGLSVGPQAFTVPLASSYITTACSDSNGCIKFTGLGSGGISNLTVVNNGTSPCFYVTKTLLNPFLANCIGSAGSDTTNVAVNDELQLGEPGRTTCPNDEDCYYLAYGADYQLYGQKIRRAIVANGVAQFFTYFVHGDSTDSNSSVDMNVISAVCNDNVNNTCGMGVSGTGLICASGAVIDLAISGGATGTVACTSTNHINNGTAVTMTYVGTGYTSAPTTATSTCAGTCGNAVLTTVVLGPYIDLLGNAAGTVNQTKGVVLGELGNSGSHTSPGDAHYSTVVHCALCGANVALVIGDDSSTLTPAYAIFNLESGVQTNHFECWYRQSTMPAVLCHSPDLSFANLWDDPAASTREARSFLGSHLGTNAQPFNTLAIAVSAGSGTSGATDNGGSKAASGSIMTYNFQGAYTNAPHCVVQNDTTANAGLYGIVSKSVSNTALTVGTANLTDTVSWVCWITK